MEKDIKKEVQYNYFAKLILLNKYVKHGKITKEEIKPLRNLSSKQARESFIDELFAKHNIK